MTEIQASTNDRIEAYRDEHRLIRDSVLAIIDAGARGEVEEARAMVEQFDDAIGPHYRYEEEVLYPLMTRFLGEDRVEELIGEQADSIDAVREMKALLDDGTLTREQETELIEQMYTLMGHIYDCDVAILMETLTDEEMAEVAQGVDRCHEEDLSLLQWAETVR